MEKPITEVKDLGFEQIETFQYVNATPEGYGLRLLRLYRKQCDGMLTGTNPLVPIMNSLQKERAKELDKAIKILEDNGIVDDTPEDNWGGR